MNKYFEKWIIEEISKTKGSFTAREIVDRILEQRGSSPHIGDAYSATWVCKKHSKRIGRGLFIKELVR
tara:strand:+ start:541 stop:744 length:204 start_codon:yes stop_codon:yes gene_type:complete